MYEVITGGGHFVQTRQFAGHSLRQIREDLCDAMDEALSNGIPNPDIQEVSPNAWAWLVGLLTYEQFRFDHQKALLHPYCRR